MDEVENCTVVADERFVPPTHTLQHECHYAKRINTKLEDIALTI